MIEDFLSEPKESPTTPNPSPRSGEDRDPLRVLLIGSRQRVIRERHKLFAMGYAQLYEWSSLQRARIPGKVMSILTKYSDKVLTELPDLDNKPERE
ncbi:hypothetical protein [Microseira wollei]|uniref:XRE family transcriptional regulator n=1 Tax=Microseira wollei NIES-4236 TaxID=2530354 RepID=A0AAV3XFT7_9CYAN|nr:hypothetical protein [Microseira wollei]GET40730.1 hypothetical protein MiSe_55410 [Microseira wollei NIES-4236]